MSCAVWYSLELRRPGYGMNKLGDHPTRCPVRPLNVTLDNAGPIVIDILDLFVGHVDEGDVVQVPLLIV